MGLCALHHSHSTNEENCECKCLAPLFYCPAERHARTCLNTKTGESKALLQNDAIRSKNLCHNSWLIRVPFKFELTEVKVKVQLGFTSLGILQLELPRHDLLRNEHPEVH